MKILFFSPYFYPYTSGITTYPYKLLTHLAAKHDITVLTFPHKNRLRRREKLNGMTIIRMPYMFRLSKGFISPQSFYYFFSQAEHADLILLNIPNFEGFPLAVIASLLGKRIISVFHCLVFPENNPLDRVVVFFLNLSIRIQLHLSRHIVAYTEDYAHHTWVGRIFRRKLKYVLPPVYAGRADNAKPRSRKGKVIIGFAGRTSREKGIEYLIEAAKSAAAQLRKRRISLGLMFAGPYGNRVSGENDYYLKIHRLLHHSGIPFEFLGNLHNNKLARFYRTIDMLALPSVNSTEAFGMVQAEAMLQGTPVICANLPGVRVPVKLTGMGLTVKPRDTKGLAEAIMTIAKNRKDFTSVSKQQLAREIFNPKKTYRFFEELVAKPI